MNDLEPEDFTEEELLELMNSVRRLASIYGTSGLLGAVIGYIISMNVATDDEMKSIITKFQEILNRDRWPQ